MKLEVIIHLRVKQLVEKKYTIQRHQLRELKRMFQLRQMLINGIVKQQRQQIHSQLYHLVDTHQLVRQATIDGQIGLVGQQKIQKQMMEELDKLKQKQRLNYNK